MEKKVKEMDIDSNDKGLEMPKFEMGKVLKNLIKTSEIFGSAMVSADDMLNMKLEMPKISRNIVKISKVLGNTMLNTNAMVNKSLEIPKFEMGKVLKDLIKTSEAFGSAMVSADDMLNMKLEMPKFVMGKVSNDFVKTSEVWQAAMLNASAMINMSAVNSSSINLENQIQENINSLRKQLNEDKIKNNKDGSRPGSCEKNINTEDIKYNENMELNIALDDASSCIGGDCVPFQEKIYNLVECFKKKNYVYWVIIYFLVIVPIQIYYNTLITKGITSPVDGTTISESNTNNKNKLEKRIKYEVKNNIVIYANGNISEKDILKKYRLVTTTNLNVRLNNSIKSRAIGTLKFGQVVTVVQKNKNWTLIEVVDKYDNTSVQGWVFTRYISKFE